MKKDLDTKRFLRKIWKLLEDLRKQIVFLLILSLFIEIVALVNPYLLKLIIDLITNFEKGEISKIVSLGALVFLVGQFYSILSFFKDKSIFRILINTESGLLKKAFEKMMDLSLAYHEKENTGNKVLKIQRGVMKISELLGNFFWEVAPTLFQIFFTLIVLFWVDWRFGLVIFFLMPVFLAMTFNANKKVYPLRRKGFDKEEEAAGAMTQSIVNVNTVKSFVQEKEETKRHGSFVNSALQNFLKGFALILRANIGRNFVIDLGRFLILVFGVFLVIRSEITIGSLVFVFTISEKALISLYRISRLYDRIVESSDAVERLHDLFQEENDIINKKDGLKPSIIKGEIEFKKLTYVYRESGIKALSDVDLKINAGSRIALVGPSGGGKTTMARMIYRHYDPTSGQILLDGVDLKEYNLFSFRKFIAIVPQEVDVFNMSIRDNIAYGNSRASMDEIREAARIANVEEFVNKINGGYDALVGERGLKLSGGQRQRLGIARAVLVKPRILIFDEATSNLDSQSERLIQDSMDKISQNRTVIVIAHRLSTIRRSDKIVVLENGKIVEQGTHKELVSHSSGLYRKLVSLQEMGDVEEDQELTFGIK